MSKHEAVNLIEYNQFVSGKNTPLAFFPLLGTVWSSGHLHPQKEKDQII